MTDQRPLLPVTQSEARTMCEKLRELSELADSSMKRCASLIREWSAEAADMIERLTAEQDGWVRVPREVSQAMKEAATDVVIETGRGHTTALNWEEAQQVWDAMIAAVPPANILDSTKEAGL